MSARLFVATGVIFYRVAISDALGVLATHIFAFAANFDIFRVKLTRGNAVRVFAFIHRVGLASNNFVVCRLQQLVWRFSYNPGNMENHGVKVAQFVNHCVEQRPVVRVANESVCRLHVCAVFLGQLTVTGCQCRFQTIG